MSIEVFQLHKCFGEYPALSPTDLRIETGEMAALPGPSGSGKTTLLRLIAGLESADGGCIVLNSRDVTNVPVRAHHIGFIFQHYALFKHLTVADNVAFGLTVLPRGQQQRVALATTPEVALFDEPFGALDVQVRQDLRLWLKGLQRELGFTGVFVTHDREEALDLADRIVVMRHGAIAQNTDPQQLYAAPADAQVFAFMSETQRFSAHFAANIVHSSHAWAKVEQPLADGEPALRVQDIELADHPPDHVKLPLVINNVTLFGANYRITVHNLCWDNDARWQLPLAAQVFRRQPLQTGQRVYIKLRQLYFLREDGTVEALLHERDGVVQPA